MSEVLDQIGAVTRRLGLEDKDGKEARVLVASQTYDTGVEDLWDAVTNPERIPRWFLPVSGDFTLGGRYQFEGNAGGTILACEPPRHLGVTWEFGGQVSWVDVEFAAAGEGRATLELRHVAHVDDDMWKQFGPGAVGIGWDSALLGLALYLGPGTPSVTPETAAEWMATDEARAFMSGCGLAWRDAAVAAGDDEAEATAAAERIIAMYTTPPDAAPDAAAAAEGATRDGAAQAP